MMRSRVRGQSSRIAPESFEACRGYHDKGSGYGFSPVGITVGHLARSKDIITWTRTERLTTNLKRVLPFQNEPCFILPLVNVQPDASRRIVGGLDQCISPASLLTKSKK